MTMSPPVFDTFTELLQWRAQSHPEKVAFRYFPDGEHETHHLSYGELDQQARQLATYLQAHGHRGKRLLLLFPPDLSFIVGFMACLYAGVTPVPAYPPEPHRLNHTLQRLHKIIEDAQASAILTVSSLAKAAQNLPLTPLQWIESDTIIKAAENKALKTETSLHPPTENDIAFLQYTSGSTGDPKGVIITHRNLMANQKMIQEAFDHTEQQAKLVCWVPFYHDMGLVGHLLQSLYVGGETLIMPPTAFLKKPVRWLRLISEHRATSTGAPNFAFDLCVRKITDDEKEGLDLSCLRMALNGAEPVQAETLQRFVKAFAPYGLDPHTPYPAYGMAEATVFITGSERERRPFYLEVDKTALAEHQIEILNHAIATPLSASADSITLVSSGRTWQDGSLRIVDPETCTPLPDLHIGELWIQGPHVASGYWQRPEASAYTFSAHLIEPPANPSTEVYCRTGDLGFHYQDQWFVTGRLKDLIIIRGRNIYPQDLERSVDTWAKQEPVFGSSLRLGCGIAIGYQEKESSTEAVVFLQEVRDPSFQDSTLKSQIKVALQTHLNQEHALPIHEVVILPPGALPKTSSGKLMRAQAAQDYNKSKNKKNSPQEQTSKASLPTSSLSSWLLHWLQKEVRWPSDHLPLQQNFQALGLDSLLAVQLVADLEKHLQRPLPETLLWDYTSPAVLLNHLEPKVAITEAPLTHHAPSPTSPTEPIAIIGMSCRFPGGIDSPEDFWRHLLAGTDSITPIPSEHWRWPHEAYYAPRNASGLPTPGKTYVRHGGFLENVYDFDPAFFQISPKEAIDMDPQQRLLLMLSWEAFESAGLIPEHYRHSQTGVFIGLSNLDYSLRNMHSTDPQKISAYSGTGVSPSTAAGRIAYTFNFHGPAITLDTACSSSLVAIHQACQSLRSGESDLAIAGGVNLILSPEGHIYFSQLQALSKEGRCKPFSEAADGFVRSEGGGLVILKPLSAALRDGNPVLGLIESSAVNHNGASNGLTAPSGLAQQQLLKKALQNAQREAPEIDYIESHGTGTALGDPIEIDALHAVFFENQASPRKHPLYIGAVKSQLGHTESASGIAGLIKTLLILKHQQIPANLHGQKLNPRLANFTQFHFPQETLHRTVRKAGVSSFGISGTNAHIILSATEPSNPPHTESASESLSTPIPISLSAPDAKTLSAKIEQLLHWLTPAISLEQQTDQAFAIDLTALSQTLLYHRTAFAYRWGAYVKNTATLITRLQQAQTHTSTFFPAVNTPLTAFVFAGQGGQWEGMGQELALTDPVFKTTLTAIDAELQSQPHELPGSLMDILFQKFSVDLNKPAHVQPLLFAIQVALAKSWMASAEIPNYVIGHSLGEVAAAYIAEAISLSDALKIMICRSRLLSQQQVSGAMLATTLSPTAADCEVRDKEGVVVGVYNSPQSTVLSGNTDTLTQIQSDLDARDIFCRLVKVNAASHSPAIEVLETELLEALSTVKGTPPRLPMWSTVLNKWIEADDLTPAYWYQNLRQPVQFATGVETLLHAGVNLWVEISPHPVLTQMIRENIPNKEISIQTFSPMRRHQPEQETLWQALINYHVSGGVLRNISQETTQPSPNKTAIKLPPFPWQGKPFEQKPSLRPSAAPLSPPVNDDSPQHWHMAWEPSPLHPTDIAQTPRGDWLIFCDQHDLQWSLEMLLKGRGQNCLWVQRGHDLQLKQNPFIVDAQATEHYRELFKLLSTRKTPLKGLIFTWEPQMLSPESLQQHYQQLLFLLQGLESLTPFSPSPRVYVLTRNAHLGGMTGGLIRTAFYEYPQWHCTHIDIGEQPSAHTYQLLATELLSDSAETQVRLREQREVARLTAGIGSPAPPLDSPSEASLKRRWRRFFKGPPPRTEKKVPAPPLVNGESTYLITGGLGLLGRQTAEWLVAQGAQHLVLMGRHGAHTEAQKKWLTTAQQHGQIQGTHIHVFQGDVTKLQDVSQCLESIAKTPYPLRGVIHCAGILKDGLITSQQGDHQQDFLAVFSPKIQGTWNLHTLTQQRGESLDFFICYSSVTGPLGMPGQSSYAAANAFMDQLMHERQTQGLPGLSVQWGPWERPELTSGLQSSSARLLLGQYGFHPLSLKNGLTALTPLLQSGSPAGLIMQFHIAKLLQALPHTQHLPLYNHLSRAQGITPPLPQHAPQPFQKEQSTSTKTSSQEHRGVQNQNLKPGDIETLTPFLTNTIAQILGLPPGQLDPQSPLRGYGFDSLMALELKAQLQAQYGLSLKHSERFQSMTITEMSERLCYPERFEKVPTTDSPEPED